MTSPSTPQAASPANRNGSPANRWIILANVMLGTFMSTLDGSIANVALPTIARETGSELHQVQWVLTAYLLTICATLPIIGKISDLYGRGRVYNLGFLVFVLGSALCSVSGSLGLLIASRVLQALGASCLMSNSQGIIAETFSMGGRGRALGIVGTVVSVGSMTGPGIGGILVGSLGWPSIFWINIPIGLIAFAAGWFILPRGAAKRSGEPFDYTGSLLFIAGMTSFLYTISNAEDWGWGSPATASLGLTALILLAAFVVWERRYPHPMLDLTLYRIRAFTLGTSAALLSFVALFCVNVMMPFYMQQVLHYSPQLTGYTMMAYPLTMALVAPFSGWASDKIDFRLLTTAGLGINALGFGLLNQLSTQESAWIIALHMALFGLGGGLFQSPNNSSIMGAVPKSKLGTAGGFNALVRNVGMVLGISFSVSLFTFRMGTSAASQGEAFHLVGGAAPAAVMAALHTVFWAAMGICLLALVVSSFRLMKRRETAAGPQ